MLSSYPDSGSNSSISTPRKPGHTNLPEGIELHILPSGSTAPSLKVRYRSTSGIAERIDAAYRAGSTYLDRVLS